MERLSAADLNKNSHKSGTPSPELQLLLTCTRWPQRREDVERIRNISRSQLDLPLFAHLTRHHRLVPLVNRNLRAALVDSDQERFAPVLEDFRQISQSNVANSLRCLKEFVRLSHLLEERGISIQVLKGLPLAQIAFGDLSLRMCGDIDIIVDETRLVEVDEIFRRAGYRALYQVENLSPRRLSFYRKHWKDLAYHNQQTGVDIDLHWRLFRNREMAGRSLLQVAGEDHVSFGSFQIRTLPSLENLVYLCVHGTIDGWLYLKSLADVAAQVRCMSQDELDALAAMAKKYQVLAELSVAMILVRRYLEMDHWSSDFLPSTNTYVSHSLRYASQMLEGSNFLKDRDRVSGTAMAAFDWSLRRGLRYRYEVLIRIFFRPRMWSIFPLPDFLFYVYPLLSPFEWLINRVYAHRRDHAKP